MTPEEYNETCSSTALKYRTVMIFVFCCTEVYKFLLLFQFYLTQMATQGIMHAKKDYLSAKRN